jgi:trans-2,3-dihydro-3-hydroxyanthranilate isomerase
MRIFTPGDELPMAGHPTIGSTFALARAGILQPNRDRFVFGLGVGPVAVTLTWRGDDLTFAWMTQGYPSFGDPIHAADAASVLGLPAASVVGTGLPVQVVSCGVPFLLVPLTTRNAVDSAVVNRADIDAFFRSAKVTATGLFVFSTERRGERATAYSRMFAPATGVAEDAATGGASGPLGCYLVRHKVVAPAKAGAMLSLQGVKMGRPSHIHISIGVNSGTIHNVRVGGEAVLAGEGTLYV